jgi:hypothetical protein
MDFKSLSDPVVIVGENNNKPGFFSKIRPPMTPFFKGKKFLGGALTVFLLFAVGVGVYLSQRPTQFTPQANQGSGELSLKPQTITVTSNQEFQIDVFLDSKNTSITAIQTKILYDSSKLQLVNNTLTDYFPVVLSQPQNTAGSSFFAVGSSPGKTGTGNIASIKFKAIGAQSSSPTKIQISRDFTEAASNDTGDFNAVTVFFDSDVTISGTASPSPSSTSQSPTPTPTPVSSQSCYDDSNCKTGEYCQFVRQTCPEGGGCAAVMSGYCLPKTGKGDGNKDNYIDLQDLSILFSKWSPAISIGSNFELDFNNDVKINSIDYLQINDVLRKLRAVQQ